MGDGRADDGRLRVALVTTSFPLTEGSMSGVFVRRLAAALARHVRLRVVVPGGPERRAAGDDAVYEVAPFRYAPRSWQRLTHRPGGLPAALARRDPLLLLLPALVGGLLVACRRVSSRVDLIHANWSVVGALAAVAAGGRTPVVTTLRGSDVARAETSPWDRWWLRQALLRSAAVAAVSPELAQRARSLLPGLQTPVVAIPNGVEPACFRVQRSARGRGAEEGVRLLAVGNLVAQKDVGTVVRALGRLPSDLGWRLRWLGEGPMRRELEALVARRGLESRIDLPGTVAPSRVPDELAVADVLVFSSRGEGRPNALLEGLAAALPAAVPRVPGVVGLVEEDREALFYEAGHPETLAPVLERLIRDHDLRRRLGEEGRRRLIERGLTWEAASARYLDLYRRALARRVAVDAAGR